MRLNGLYGSHYCNRLNRLLGQAKIRGMHLHMRILSLITFFIFLLNSPSIFSAEINNSNVDNNGQSSNISGELFPYGFVFIKNGAFYHLVNNLSDESEVDRFLGSNLSYGTSEFDWQKWLQSRNSGDSRVLLGGLPFVSLPRHGREEDEQKDSTLFSTDKFFFFWYFKQRF